MKAEITFDSKDKIEILLGNVYKGDKGESAYDYAVKGGYSGSEEDFANTMANSLSVEVTGTI